MMENKKDRQFTEEEIQDQIMQSAEAIEVPDSLKPENIEKMLAKKKKRRTPVYGMVAAAACCCIIVGVAALSGREVVQEKEAEKIAEVTADQSDSQMASAKDYEQIYQYIQAAAKEETSTYAGGSAGDMALYTAEKAVSEDQGVAHSDTNVRTEGVEEGDTVKTDGKYLYIMSMDQVQILNIESEEMQEVGKISMDPNDYLLEIYLKDQKLVCVYTRVTEVTDSQGTLRGKDQTVAEVFDVSDPTQPKSLGEMSQSGSFRNMRVSGDYMYLLSTFYADVTGLPEDISTYVPEVQGKVMDSSHILLPQQEKGRVYTVVTSFNLKDPTKQTDYLAFFGDSTQCYVSEDHIYVYDTIYDAKVSKVTQTEIRKVSYKDGKLDGTGHVVIDGVINDSFSIDEYEGYLRVVTTIRENDDTSGGVNPLLRIDGASDASSQPADSTNTLYILNKDLKEVGKLENLAEGEQVYSARFMGDSCYFVTYKQVDPLFSVDLSDPKKPKVLGELKIPGFSDYLHPYGDGLLLGIGMDVEEDGATVNGVKLSMFDISDPKDVKEIHKTVLEECYSTDVSYNYRAAFVDVEKNLIGFPGYKEQQEYYIYSYDKEKGFTCVFEKTLSGYSDVRGLYAGERFYLVTEGTVESYRLDNFEKVDDVVL
ncbi:MAG: beta-propeller domain-containing protein [Eubacteriales bacterium]|nr:beta-propeller domain-containing protein [Eubacteriales bacterium]